jgi:hypothetical protein
LIPRDEWTRAFKLPAVRGAGGQPSPVALALGSERFTFASLGQSLAGPPAEGRWPDTLSVLPKTHALVTIHVPARQLAELLNVLAALPAEDGGSDERVSLHYYGEGKPIGLTTQRGPYVLDALLMPLEVG